MFSAIPGGQWWSAIERNHEFLAHNFLKDSSLVCLLLYLSSIEQNDLIYEIGAGKGILKAGLAQRCQQLIAAEKDPRLAAWLRQRFASSPGVTIVQADFLDLRLPDEPYKVFANIPFNCTAVIMEKITRSAQPPLEVFLVMKHEAAAVYCGSPRETLRAVLLKPFFSTEIIHHFDRRDFNPPPGVDAVLLRLRKQQPRSSVAGGKHCSTISPSSPSPSGGRTSPAATEGSLSKIHRTRVSSGKR